MRHSPLRIIGDLVADEVHRQIDEVLGGCMAEGGEGGEG